MVQLLESSRLLLRTFIAMQILVSLSVIGRLLARLRKRAQLGWDDAWAIVAWIMFTIFFGLQAFEITQGYYQILDIPISATDMVLKNKIEYSGALIFETANIASKISLLCLYRRIFSTPTFYKWSWAVLVFCMAWYFSSIIATAVKCIPATKAWMPDEPGKCIDLIAFLMGYEVGNMVCDIAILCLPVRMIHSLQLSRTQKIFLSGIFLLGGFVIITSILRVVYTYGQDPRVSLVNVPLWSCISVAASVICASLPVLRPILPGRDTLLHFYTWSTRPFKGRSGAERSHSSAGIYPIPGNNGSNRVKVTSGSYDSLGSNSREQRRPDASEIGGHDSRAQREYPLDSIRVHQTVDVN